MAKSVELRRHTANDGDALAPEGIKAAVEIGSSLTGGYEIAISSGAQRATQTLACLLAGLGEKVPGGVTVEPRFRSEIEDRWFSAYEKAGAGDIESFQKAAPELVEAEAERFGGALKDVFDRLADDGRALVVGHSPMQEVAVFGLTRKIVDPLSKGAGVLVTQRHDDYEVEPLD